MDTLCRSIQLVEWNADVDREEGIETSLTETVTRLLEEAQDVVFCVLTGGFVPRRKRRHVGLDVRIRWQECIDVERSIRTHHVDEKPLASNRSKGVRITDRLRELFNDPVSHASHRFTKCA